MRVGFDFAMTPLVFMLIFGLLAHANISLGYNDDDIGKELPPELTRNDLDDNPLENAASELDTFEDDVINHELEKEENAAEHGVERSDPKWFRRLIRKVKRGGKKFTKGFRQFTKRVRKITKGFKKVVKGAAKVMKKGFKLTKTFIKEVIKLRRRKVCYKPYGCFHRYRFIWDLLPQSPRKVKTKFFLATREHPKGIRINPLRLGGLKFKNRKTIVITHGWKGHYGRERWIRGYRALFLRRGNFNVIEVYWGGGARTSFYPIAAGNTRLVGRQIAYLIERLHTKFCLSFNNVHLIGHSLGAHVAGHAGKTLRLKNYRIARISGLDPAGPIFARRNRKVRLDSTDANFVDVIHTSFLYFLGVKGRAGTADFYVNGGGAQPGCGKNGPVCSHARVIDLYMKTILPKCRFKAYSCKKCGIIMIYKGRLRLAVCKPCQKSSNIYMGYDVSKRARGEYLVTTTSTTPYCKSS